MQENELITESFELLIVGAGMSGLCMGIQAKLAGIHNFVILEKSSDLGGTWLNNRYPGAHCDVPSHLYSFSFAPKGDWLQKFASATEIHAYMHECAERYDLKKHFRFNTAISRARFHEGNHAWRVTTANGQTLNAKFLTLSTAPLNEPNMPDIPGFDSFAQPIFHTAQWPSSIDLKDKHVGIIGSAASAVQVIPHLAATAATVTVYQRTPNWILPRGNKVYGTAKLTLFKRPIFRSLYRGFLFCLHETNRLGFSKGSAVADLCAKMASTLAKRHLKAQIPNAQLREKLTPQYNFGCKRVLISDDFYPSLNRPNVNVVVDKIVRIDKSGITTDSDQRFTHDIIVCATGFELDHLARTVDVQGLSGITLQQAFKDGPQAYLGTVIRDMPNLFMLLGPNTATGHTSTLLYIEAQVKLSLRLIQELVKSGKSQLVVKPSVFEQYDQQLQARFAQTSWSGSCLSWYKTASGRNIAIWPGSTRQFWKTLDAATLDDFEVA